jgi:hypothetical protein
MKKKYLNKVRDTGPKKKLEKKNKINYGFFERVAYSRTATAGFTEADVEAVFGGRPLLLGATSPS